MEVVLEISSNMWHQGPAFVKGVRAILSPEGQGLVGR